MKKPTRLGSGFSDNKKPIPCSGWALFISEGFNCFLVDRLAKRLIPVHVTHGHGHHHHGGAVARSIHNWTNYTDYVLDVNKEIFKDLETFPCFCSNHRIKHD
jgi:hypothetical protein